MKRAIAYIRISNRDQSNFSLGGQEQYIREYCQRKGIDLINLFIDNGQSAKNFDRADWKKLENFVKSNYQEIDHLIVVKYDRFSRDVVEGLNMINKLEKKYNITILSVFEEIGISPDSPFYFKMRTDMLVQAEFELRVIKDRTNFGIRQAKKEGRWVSRAPYGYTNVRDQDDKPTLAVNPIKSGIVKDIFRLYDEGTTIEEIRKQALKKGFKLKGNSAVTRILTNPIYAGFIPLDNELVKGGHKPIIDFDTFSRVRHTFKGQKQKIVINDEVPLRGSLLCFCGRPLTAGKSKGKSTYVWYYKCKSHLNININAKGVHAKMLDLMHGLSLSPNSIDKLKTESEERIKKLLSERHQRLPQLKKDCADIEKKLSNLEEKFILNQITFDTYSKWRQGMDNELKALQKKIEESPEASVWERYRQQLNHLTDMAGVYDTAKTHQKQTLVNTMFNRSLQWGLNSFVTAYLMDIFKSNELVLKEKGLLVINSPSYLNGQIPVSSGNGSIVELFETIKLIAS